MLNRIPTPFGVSAFPSTLIYIMLMARRFYGGFPTVDLKRSLCTMVNHGIGEY